MPNPLDMVTEDQRDDNPPRRVYIYTNPDAPEGEAMLPAGGNKLTQAVAPEQPSDLMANIAKLRDYVAQFGTGILDQLGVAGMQPGPKRDAAVTGRNAMVGIGDEQDLLWPQRMVRSGVTLPGDVASGAQPVIDPDTGRTSSRVIERAMDTAGLMGGGALTERPGTASLGSGPIRKAAVTELAPVFYSALEHAVENSAQNTATPEQWVGFLKNTPGVKAEEIQWTGIGDWLKEQKGKVSKDDVKAYLDEHKVELKDVTKQEQTWDQLSPRERERVTEDFHEYEPDNNDPAAIRRFYDDARGAGEYEQSGIGGDTKYSEYQLPGGENYREHLLTLPDKRAAGPKTFADWAAKNDKQDNATSRAEYSTWNASNRDVTGGNNYKSSHWDEPNVLAHVRTNDRFMPRTPDSEAAAAHQGKMQQFRDRYNAINDELKNKPGWPASVARDPRVAALEKEYGVPDNATPAQLEAWERGAGDTKPVKSLHIEEIQSDWHQQGRKGGYKSEESKAEYERLNKELQKAQEDASKRAAELGNRNLRNDSVYQELKAKAGNLEAQRSKVHPINQVPDAPFKTTWPELAMKRMIRHAAENGYDRISWTPGEAQAARYDLSKHYQDIRAYKKSDGKIDVWGRPAGVAGPRNAQHIAKDISPEKLSDIVGKELADKIANQQPEFEKTYSGVDLKVGGEGMREFYDKMLPKMAEKIGKAHGVKIKRTNISSIDGPVAPYQLFNGETSVGYFGSEAQAKAFAKKEGFEPKIKMIPMEDQIPVHYFDLPQSLKERAVGKGFPLYMAGIPFPLTPVDRDPFRKKERK